MSSAEAKVGIIGATGYVGAELIRLLLNHTRVNIEALGSVNYQGQNIDNIYKNLKENIDLSLYSPKEVIKKSDIVFMCLPHGLSEDYADECIKINKKCIDLGADFRLNDEEKYSIWYGRGFSKPKLHKLCAYGLPEIYRKQVKDAKIIANPGCYPTSVILGIMPALRENILDIERGGSIIIDSKSGITGAGRALSQSTHFPESNENFSPYKIASHRHIPEIEQVLSDIADKNISITFVPHLLPINRGILSTIYCTLYEDKTIEEIHEIYKNYYKNEPFVRVLDKGLTANIKNVKYSNYCDISIHKDSNSNRLIIVSAIDNMVKGAAGQAIQNMNIILGLCEKEGLLLVPPAF